MTATRSLRIFLADLTHVGNGIATEAFPLNVGLVASYARRQFGNAVSISLFKYPEELEQHLRDAPPEILACSNYTWNSNLSYHFIRLAKSLRPDTLTVFGGTNYPFDSMGQQRFLAARPHLDMHVFYEGEIGFSNIIERRLGVEHNRATLEAPVSGVHFVDRESEALIAGPQIPRLTNLDGIPSPYSTGLLDKFFDGLLTPLVETARGCPFRCNFCNAGDIYFQKMNLFSDAYVEEELTYVARMASQHDVGHVTFADNNFGMVPRDSRTAELLVRLQEQYGWPKSVTIWTGKNSKERVIEVTRRLGETLSISMSVQSMDTAVLKTIKRDNIKLEHYRKIADELNTQGRPQHAEVIMPLPGESMASHISGLNALLNSNVRLVQSHTLQMLHGTPYKDDEQYRRRFGYVTKWRVVPLDFSRIGDRPVFDVEEVAVATSTLSFLEYVEARKYLLMIDLAYNNSLFDPLKRYLRERQVPNSRWIGQLYENRSRFDDEVKEIVDSFERETRAELWETEKDLVAFYSRPANFDKLKNYEAGGNVLYKHRVWTLSRSGRAWVESVFRLTEPLLLATASSESDKRRVQHQLTNLRNYVVASVAPGFSESVIDSTVAASFDFDVPAYIRAPRDRPLSEFALPAPLVLVFGFDERMRQVLRDGFQRYGSHLAGLVKMVQRVQGVSFVRTARHEGVSVSAVRDLPPERHYGPGYSSL